MKQRQSTLNDFLGMPQSSSSDSDYSPSEEAKDNREPPI